MSNPRLDSDWGGTAPKAKAAAPVDIQDAALKTAYDTVNKQEAAGEGEAAPATEGQQ